MLAASSCRRLLEKWRAYIVAGVDRGLAIRAQQWASVHLSATPRGTRGSIHSSRCNIAAGGEVRLRSRKAGQRRGDSKEP